MQQFSLLFNQKFNQGFPWRSRGYDFAFQRRRFGLNPCSGSYDPTWLMAKKSNYRKEKQYCNNFNKDFKNCLQQKIFLKKLQSVSPFLKKFNC